MDYIGVILSNGLDIDIRCSIHGSDSNLFVCGIRCMRFCIELLVVRLLL